MKEIFNDRLAAAKPIEEVLLPGDDIPITIFYPSYEQVYLREDIKLKSQEIYWKDIEFGIYKDLLEDHDVALMELVSRFDCGFTLEEQLYSTMPIPTQFLEERKNTINWDLPSAYWGLRWSFELLQQFDNYWVTKELIKNHTAFNYCLKNDLDDEFIEKVLA